MPRTLRALLGLAAVLVAGQAVNAAGLWQLTGPARLWDEWVSAFVPLAPAVIVAARAVLVPTRRMAWSVLAVGLWAWAIANGLWALAFDHGQSTAALALFFVFYPCAATFLALGARARCSGLPRTVWLDLIAGVLTVCALGFGIVLPLVPDAGVAALAFPILDVALVAMVVALFTIARWAPSPDWLACGLAFAALATGDLLYAVWDGATQTSLMLWSAGPLLFGCAAWMRADRRSAPARAATRLLWPYALFLSSFGLVIAGNFADVSPSGLWLAVASMLVTAYRTAQTFRAVRMLPETRRQARTDELTGLTNRRGFFDAVEHELQRHPDRPAAVLMLDLDRFKELNDTLGHAAGDRLLTELGPRLSSGLRPGDTLARLGGDEFAVLCPGAAAPAARRVARRLQAGLDEPFAIGDLHVHVDASVGIAAYPKDGATVAALLQRADVAMYQAKGDGTEVELYDAARDDHSRDKLALAGELRRALDGGGQIELHYQPQTCLRTDRVVGVEALVRWRHPDRGLLAPGAFLSVAEGSGLMRRLGREVLRSAIGQAAAWQRDGQGVAVAVNLSSADLVDGALPTEVAQLLDAHTLDGSWLTIEITENTIMAQPERVTQTLHDLRALGCRVSLDDFGTGHASLEHLAHLPVDELKIDRSFVLGLDRGDPAAMAIVRALSLLGRDLGLSVVAEGVETPRAWGQLVASGCSSAQGYLVSRPLPANELALWLSARRDAERRVA